jgi:hypothetical protein
MIRIRARGSLVPHQRQEMLALAAAGFFCRYACGSSSFSALRFVTREPTAVRKRRFRVPYGTISLRSSRAEALDYHTPVVSLRSR